MSGWQDGQIVDDDGLFPGGTPRGDLTQNAFTPPPGVQSAEAPPDSDGPYPAQGGYQPNAFQSATAWTLYKGSGIDPDAPIGSIKQPTFAVAGRPATPGSYFIDQTGHLRIAGDNDDGGLNTVASSDPTPTATILAQEGQPSTGQAAPPPGLIQDGVRGGWGGLLDGAVSLSNISNPFHTFTNGLQTLTPALGTRANAAIQAWAPWAGGEAVGNGLGMTYAPQTWLGRYAHAFGEQALNAIEPESAFERLAAVAAPALLGQAASDSVKALGLGPNSQSAAGLVGKFAGSGGLVLNDYRDAVGAAKTDLIAPAEQPVAQAIQGVLDHTDPTALRTALAAGVPPVMAAPGFAALNASMPAGFRSFPIRGPSPGRSGVLGDGGADTLAPWAGPAADAHLGGLLFDPDRMLDMIGRLDRAATVSDRLNAARTEGLLSIPQIVGPDLIGVLGSQFGQQSSLPPTEP